MAYISSATTATLQLTLTDYGRERLIVGSKGIEVTFDRFGISDGDIDYRNTQAHADTTSTANNSAQLGFIPDVTGNRSNFRKAVNNGYKQKNFVYQTPQNTNLNRRQSSQKFVTVGVKGTNNAVDYYKDNVEIACYLHDYYVLNKLLAARYVADHKDTISFSPSTIESSCTTYFQETLGIKNDDQYIQFLNDLSNYGVGQYLDFWDSIKVYDGNSFETENIKLVPEKDFSYFNAVALAGGGSVGSRTGRLENTGIDFSQTILKGLKVPSPFSLMFSPGLATNNVYIPGTGPAGIGFEAFDVGYLNVGGESPWNNSAEPYPTFTMTNAINGWSTNREITNNEETGERISNMFIGFVTSVDMETAVPMSPEGFLNPGYSNFNTTIPTTRLVLNVNNNNSSTAYYPLKLKRLTKQKGNLVNVNNQNAKGMNITLAHPSDTFGLLIGSLQYAANWNDSQLGLKSGAPYFTLQPSKDNGVYVNADRVATKQDPYYTLGTQMMKMADNIFVSLASQSNRYWRTDTYSGGYKSGLSGTGISSYNISIPITWNVHSLNSPTATPCKVTVRFIFNKDAVRHSIPYENVSSQNYYRLFDSGLFLFYGEDGQSQASNSRDPRGHNYLSGSATYSWQTSGGKALFRKVTRGTKI